LRSLIKIYTEDNFYQLVRPAFVDSNFHQLKHYITSIVNLQKNLGEDNKYLKKGRLYRGTGGLKIEDYKENGIHFWPNMTSSSKSKKIAKEFAFRYNNPRVIFEIFVN